MNRFTASALTTDGEKRFPSCGVCVEVNLGGVAEAFLWPRGLQSRLSVFGAAQTAVFMALQSEYFLQLTGLADPAVTANGAVGKTNSCNEAGSVCEAADVCCSLKPARIRRRKGLKVVGLF